MSTQNTIKNKYFSVNLLKVTVSRKIHQHKNLSKLFSGTVERFLVKVSVLKSVFERMQSVLIRLQGTSRTI